MLHHTVQIRELGSLCFAYFLINVSQAGVQVNWINFNQVMFGWGTCARCCLNGCEEYKLWPIHRAGRGRDDSRSDWITGGNIAAAHDSSPVRDGSSFKRSLRLKLFLARAHRGVENTIAVALALHSFSLMML
jgi:hypothetical protein